MNNLHYIGRRISSFELYDDLGPITGVSLLLDDESEPINAGDATGYVLEISCPYGTQIMATEILSAVQGRTYKGFRAENAILDPLAELGDYLSIGGSTFLLAHRIATFGPGHMSEVSAPGENELEHEYAWVNPEKKEFNQKISYVRSEISKNSGEIKLLVERTDELGRYYSSITQSVDNITLEVQGLRGNFSSLSVEVDGIRTSVSDTNDRVSTVEQRVDGISAEVRGLDGQYAAIYTKVDGIALEVHGENGDGGLAGQYTAIDQRVNNLAIKVVGVDGEETSVKLSDGQIDLSGLVTFSALSGENPGTTKINGGWIDTDTLTVKNIEIADGSITWKKLSDGAKENIASPNYVSDYVGGLVEEGTLVTDVTVTEITQDAIKTCSITANQITSGTIKAGNLSLKGSLRLDYGSLPYGYVGASNAGDYTGAVLCDDTQSNYFIATRGGARMTSGDSSFYVIPDGCYSTKPLQEGSDERLKNNISYDLGDEEKLFMRLRPCSFQMNADEKGKRRWGFIAQNVIESATEVGMDVEKLAFIGESDGMYALAYSQITALNTHMIQKLMSRVAELEERL